jgi:restriction system protein
MIGSTRLGVDLGGKADHLLRNPRSIPTEAWVATGEARASLQPVQAKAGASFDARGEVHATLQPLQATATEVVEEDGVVFEDGVFEDGVFVTKHLPAITLKTVVLDLGAKTREGTIVLAVREPFYDILKIIEHDASIAYQIDWRKWEELIAGAWKRSKLFDEVILTPRSGDKGRDVIATKWGGYSIRIFDQVKAYRPGLLVTEGEVLQMLAILGRDRNVSKGYITTTSDFAPGVWKDKDLKRYMPHRLELTHGEKLLAWLADPSRKRS